MSDAPLSTPPIIACPRCGTKASIGRGMAGCDKHCGWLCDLLTIRAARRVSERTRPNLDELNAMERYALKQLAFDAIEKGMSIVLLAHDVERPNPHVRPENYTGITTHYWTVYCIPIQAIHGLIGGNPLEKPCPPAPS